LSVGPVFNHPVEYKLLSWPLPHPHIVPPADFDPAACFKLPLVLSIDRRQRPRVVEFDLSPTHRRASETAIGRRPQVKDTITRHASENRKPQLVNRPPETARLCTAHPRPELAKPPIHAV